MINRPTKRKCGCYVGLRPDFAVWGIPRYGQTVEFQFLSLGSVWQEGDSILAFERLI